MRLFFATPYWGIAAGAAAVAVLAALYLWRRRAANFEVPALFLWDLPEMRERGGRRFMPRRPPVAFYLELGALLAMSFAAATPYLLRPAELPPLAVVLDDSYSMSARTGAASASPREQGLVKIKRLLAEFPQRRVLFFAAGAEPRMASDSSDADPTTLWRCTDELSDIAGAIALARSRIPGAELLVISDRDPGIALGGDTGIACLGRPAPNLAILNARRGGDKLLLEVGNFSGAARRATLLITGGREMRENLELAAGEHRKLVLKIPPAARGLTLTAELQSDGDALACDNSVTMLPENSAPVKYVIATGFSEAALDDLGAVLDGNADFARSAAAPELEFIPAGVRQDNPAAVRLIWHEGKAAAATADAVTLKSGDVMCDGLSSPESRWAADSAEAMPGEPLVRRGRVVLISRLPRADGGIDFHLNLDAAKSSIAATPFWPELFFNLAAVARSRRPGPVRANFRCGENVSINLPPEAESAAKVTEAGGAVRTVAAVNSVVRLAGLPPGVSRIEAGTESWEVAGSNFSAAESDLSKSAFYELKPENPPVAGDGVRRNLAFAGILLAMALLAIHQWLFARNGRQI